MRTIYSAYDGERNCQPAKDEETGMVWCPMKRSGMAVMACAANQEALGCGFGCENRATAGQIAAVKVSVGVMQDACAGPTICPRCRWPKSRAARVCLKCRGAVGGARRGPGIFIGPHRT